MSGPIPMLPTYPDVRCDRCRHVYTVNQPPEGGLINGLCPRCGHERFSTQLSSVHSVPAIAEWQLSGAAVLRETEQ